MPLSFIKFLALTGLIFFLGGCLAHSHPSAWGENRRGKDIGVFHMVEKGQTLWRIAQTYQVPLEKIRKVNKLGIRDEIKSGQKLWIPGAQKVLFLTIPNAFDKQDRPLFGRPLHGSIIRSFGLHGFERSEGIDIEAPEESCIRAAAKGQVIYTEHDVKGYGQIIIIQHSGGYTSVYAHNLENKVELATLVQAGQMIAQLGKTHQKVIPFLHFEIRYLDQALDPISFFP